MYKEKYMSILSLDLEYWHTTIDVCLCTGDKLGEGMFQFHPLVSMYGDVSFCPRGVCVCVGKLAVRVGTFAGFVCTIRSFVLCCIGHEKVMMPGWRLHLRFSHKITSQPSPLKGSNTWLRGLYDFLSCLCWLFSYRAFH